MRISKTIEVVVLMTIASAGVMGTGTLIQHALAASEHANSAIQYKKYRRKSWEKYRNANGDHSL